MGVIIAKQEEITAYFESECVNQSSLKNLTGGLDGFLASVAKRKKDKEENKPLPDYFLIGGAVDTILTGEKGEFEKQYYVSTLEKKPSEAEVLIINQVFDELVKEEIEIDLPLEGYLDQLLIAIVDQNWYKGNPGPKRTQGLLERGTSYFEDLKNSLGKKILSSEMNHKIQTIVSSLRHNPKTKKYFDTALQETMTNMDFYYQLPIFFSYKGVECKALLDLVIVHKDDNGNIIKIEPIDLKTMSGNTLQFITKIRQHRYDIQAAWYTEALLNYFNVKEGQIELFKFIVESTTSVGKPLVYEINRNTLNHGRDGSPTGLFTDIASGRQLFYPQVKGYQQLMGDYIHYSENEFREDRIIESNPVIIPLDWTQGILS